MIVVDKTLADRDTDIVEIWIANDGGIEPSFFMRFKNAFRALLNRSYFEGQAVVLYDDDIRELKSSL